MWQYVWRLSFVIGLLVVAFFIPFVCCGVEWGYGWQNGPTAPPVIVSPSPTVLVSPSPTFDAVVPEFPSLLFVGVLIFVVSVVIVCCVRRSGVDA